MTDTTAKATEKLKAAGWTIVETTGFVHLIGPLWQNMGFREIPRREFLTRLAEAVKAPGKTGRWQTETDLATVSHWQPAAGADD